MCLYRRRPRARPRRIGLVKPVAKRIEDEHEYETTDDPI
jgi:hypothetical protein